MYRAVISALCFGTVAFRHTVYFVFRSPAPFLPRGCGPYRTANVDFPARPNREINHIITLTIIFVNMPNIVVAMMCWGYIKIWHIMVEFSDILTAKRHKTLGVFIKNSFALVFGQIKLHKQREMVLQPNDRVIGAV